MDWKVVFTLSLSQPEKVTSITTIEKPTAVDMYSYEGGQLSPAWSRPEHVFFLGTRCSVMVPSVFVISNLTDSVTDKGLKDCNRF
jgi:hypothetical protein